MNWYKSLRMLPKIVLPVSVMLVLALGILSWQIQSRSSEAISETAERELASMAGKYGNEVRLFFEFALNETEGVADSLAQALEDNVPLSRELAVSMSRGLEKSSPSFIGAGMAWERNAFDGRDDEYAATNGQSFAHLGCAPSGRFAPYAVAGEAMMPLEDLESSDYYTVPRQRRQSSITKPYIYQINGKDILMTSASAAVMPNGRFAGVVVVDLEVNTLLGLVQNLKVYESGWAAVLTQDGSIIAYGDQSMVGKSMLETNHVGDKSGLQAAMRDGKTFIEQHDNGKNVCIYYYYPVKFQTTGQSWYFVICAPLDEVLADASFISNLTMIISGVALLLALLIMYVVVRASVKPLTILAGTAQEIAKGNLHVEINDEGFGGEIKELSGSFKEMIASLLENISRAEAMSEDAKAQTKKAEEAMSEAEAARQAAENAKREGMLAAAEKLEDVVNILSSASEELAMQIEQSERGSQDQAASVSQTAAAMEEMTSTVLEVARNASVAAEGSDNAKQKAAAGSEVVRRSIDALERVQQSAEVMSQEVTSLGGQAEAIGRVMTVISDIADQTNLLALNAAIEAARAGEYGRGFAVVADEVRKLAEKTMTATKEVGEAITGIQQGTQRSISSMQDAAKNVEDATGLAHESGSALAEIVNESDQVAAQIQTIAAAAEEQSATSEEINRSLGHVNELAGQSAAYMREASTAIAELAKQAHALSSLIHEMKEA